MRNLREFGKKTFTCKKGEVLLTLAIVGGLVAGGMYAYNHIAKTYMAAGKAEQTNAQIEYKMEQQAKATENFNEYKEKKVEKKRVLKKALKKKKSGKARAKAIFKSLERNND